MYLGKEVRILLKDQAKESYIKLTNRNDKESQSIIHSINRIKETLRKNPQFWDPIAKRLIPKSLRKKGIHNLHRIELSNYWRMLYTVEGNESKIFLFILRIIDHKGYNKLFGYN